MELEKDSLKRIIDNLYDGLYFVDRDRIITYWNKAAEKISGFTADEVVGKSCSDDILTHVDSDGNNICTGMCPLAATIIDRKSREAEVYMHHKAGHRIPVSIRVSVLTDRDGNITGGVELFTDISNQKANKLRVKELEELALLDNLTQLPNRNYIEKEIQSRFEEIKRFNVPFGILFMDIDHFKKFNDMRLLQKSDLSFPKFFIGNPVSFKNKDFWIPACAGMTAKVILSILLQEAQYLWS